jgi:hypothetical protein
MGKEEDDMIAALSRYSVKVYYAKTGTVSLRCACEVSQAARTRLE